MLDVNCKAKYMHSIFIQNYFKTNFVPKDLCYWYAHQPGFINIPSVHKYVKTHPISFFLNNCNQGEQSLEGSACFGRACNGIWDKKFWNWSSASGSQKNRPYGGMLGENAALFEELYSIVQSSTFIHMEDTHARMHGQSS